MNTFRTSRHLAQDQIRGSCPHERAGIFVALVQVASIAFSKDRTAV